MRAVQFDRYGGAEVLEVREVPDPEATEGRVVVRVRAAAINPGEIAIREGAFEEMSPTTFPCGEGSDLAGVVERVGDGVADLRVGDEVLGWTDERASHAELVAVPADQLVHRPASLPWEVAGSMFVAPVAGYAGVAAVDPQPGETVVVSGAAGGVGGVAAQLARATGARVIGLAGAGNHDWLRERGVVPVEYGPAQADRIREAAPDGVDALVDTFGGGYLDLGVDLGVPIERMTTVIDFARAGELGVQTTGSSQVVDQDVVGRLAGLAATGAIDVPVRATYALDDVRAAFEELADRHGRGKIVLVP